MISIPVRRTAIAATVFLACVTGFPALMAEDSGMQGNSRILGKITQPDGKTAVPDATVIAYHLSSKQFFSSAPSDAKGGYMIPDLFSFPDALPKTSTHKVDYQTLQGMS